MERLQESWKRYPLLVIGEPALPLPGAIELPLTAVGTPDSLPINEFYVLLAISAEAVPSAIARLTAAGVPPEQIIASLPAEACVPAEYLPWTGVLDLADAESPDELRARLLARLEGQRQKKLNFALQEALDRGLARMLPDAELVRVLDGTRIAHSLACAYSLSPFAHSKALRACLEGPATPSGPWSAETAMERIVVECAFLFLDCRTRGTNFREQLKERSAGMPFRARSELLHHIETGLGFLLEDKHNAA